MASCSPVPPERAYPVGEAVALSGLQPGTTYAYRIAVASGAGSDKGEAVRSRPWASPRCWSHRLSGAARDPADRIPHGPHAHAHDENDDEEADEEEGEREGQAQAGTESQEHESFAGSEVMSFQAGNPREGQ